MIFIKKRCFLAICFLACCTVFIFLIYSSPAISGPVEKLAEELARQHNTATGPNGFDGITRSFAQARGNNVIITNVVTTIDYRLPTKLLKEMRSAIYKETVPRMCDVGKRIPEFMDGLLYYTMEYHTAYGERIAEMVISNKVCDSKF